MGIVITVDLGTSSPSDIARAAKFMLECAGYQDPSVVPTGGGAVAAGTPSTLVGARGSLGEEISDDNGPLPAATVFGQSLQPPMTSEQIADQQAMQSAFGDASGAGVGDNSLQSVTDYPLPESMFGAAKVRELPPPPPGIEVDAQGVPWDQRIHAGSRAKIADGTWRQRRNLDPVVFKQVMDELRATMGVERRAPTPPAPPAPVEVFAPHPPVPPIPVAPPVPTMAAINAGPHAGIGTVPGDYLSRHEDAASTGNEVPPVPFAGSAVPPAPPTSGTPPVPASAGAATAASPGSALPTFPQLMQRITAAFTAKTLDQPTIIAAVQKVGLTSLPMLASRPDLVADVATELGIAL